MRLQGVSRRTLVSSRRLPRIRRQFGQKLGTLLHLSSATDLQEDAKRMDLRGIDAIYPLHVRLCRENNDRRGCWQSPPTAIAEVQILLEFLTDDWRRKRAL